MVASLTDFRERKKVIRQQAIANRNALPNKDELSRVIWERLLALPEFQTAGAILFYVDIHSEVRTQQHLALLLQGDKHLFVPYCEDGDLKLFRLESMDELAPGMYRTIEPKVELRQEPGKHISVQELDLVVVPGLAFDHVGARLGQGFGYYDKLLRHARRETTLLALAFECQIFPEIPTEPHDVFLDKIITEGAVYTGKGRSPSCQ
jgi:5-formyltetrahydrofolate cyclo-ligase